MNFPALLEGGPPQTLVERLGQVNAGVDDSGASLAALGLPWGARGGPWGLGVRLTMKTLRAGFVALTAGILSRLSRAGMD